MVKRPTRAPTAHRDGHGGGTGAITVTGKRSERGRTGSAGGAAGTMVNFNKLRVETLHKYRKHYKLDVSGDSTKQKLVTSIANHFIKEKVDESKVLMAFMAALAGGGSAGGSGDVPAGN